MVYKLSDDNDKLYCS